MTRSRLGVAVVMLAAAAASGRAQQAPANPRAIQPERPTVATHAGTVAPRYLEIEAGAELDRDGSSNSYSGPTVLKFGLAPRLQLELLGGSNSPASFPGGVADVGVGVKWRVLDDSRILGDFAILPGIKLPTGAVRNNVGTGTTDVSLVLVSSRDLGGVSMDLNVGYMRRSGNGSVAPKDATFWTASFGGSLAGRLGWTAEVFGYPTTHGPAGQPSSVSLLAGPTYLLRDWIGFDAGFITPLTGPQPHSLYAGMVVNVGRLW